MQDLSALTPPLIMCAVVIFAIVAFLRYELRRSGSDTPAQDEENPIADDHDGAGDGRERHDSGVPRTPAGDG